MADELKVSRMSLVLERRSLNLNYGCLFVLHLLQESGAKAEALAAELHSGKNVFQIGDDLHADWKDIIARTKKLNRQIEENLYHHFMDSKADWTRDDAEHYQVTADGVLADKDVSNGDVNEAEYVFTFWQEQAMAYLHRNGLLSTTVEQAARNDNARDGGPIRGHSGKLAPAAGGLPTN